tara:strand:+ start:1666 stop:3651 length:1986 start_codon:yes stop_codon:yes gene_type:complete
MSEASKAGATDLDTFPKLLLHHARQRPDQAASREKEYGIWQTWTWKEVAEETRALACGLAAKGLRRGDKIAIVGDNRPRLYWTMAAAQAIGAIPVPLYQDSVAKEMAFVLEHAEIHVALAENQEQVDKLLEIMEEGGAIELLIYDDDRGLRNYNQPFLFGFEAIQETGRAYDQAHPGFFEKEVAASQGSDVSILCYTSGTTGNPKGVVLSFDNILLSAKNGVALEGLTDKEEVLAYLPMAWVGDHIFSYGQAMIAGFCVSCPESADTVMHDLRELGPTYFFAPPRIFENILTNVMIRMEDASAFKRKLFHYFMAVAKRAGTKIINGEAVGLTDRLLYGLGDLLFYGPLKNTLGFSRIRLAYTAGEAIGPEIFDFYRSLGVNLKQLYGSTEASVFISIQPNGEIYADTVGKPAKDVDIRITEQGEVEFRGPGVFVEYYKNAEATAETKNADGWVATGDAGYFDDRGHLKIIDRAKDVGKLNNGSMFAPKYLENKLKFFPNIKEVVAFGDARDHVCAFINIDMSALSNWAERTNVPYGSYQELAANPQVYQIIKGHIEQVNRDLADDPMQVDSQIRRFLILNKELDPDDGELTRTRKVRRRIVAERYKTLIEALYGEQDSGFIEIEVTFEDGRKGRISGDLTIMNCQTFAPPSAGQGSRQAAE